MLAKLQFLVLLGWPFLLCAALAGLAWALDCPMWAVIVTLAAGVVFCALWGWLLNNNMHIT